MSLDSKEIELWRKYKDSWRERVLRMAPAMANSFAQTWEASFAAFPAEFQVQAYADIRSVIRSYVEPISATAAELAALNIDITAEGTSLALEADALLVSGGYFVRSVKVAVGGQKKFDAFLMEARFRGNNTLNAVFKNRTPVPVTLLKEVIPANEKQSEEYLLQRHEIEGCVMSNAAAADVYNNSHWRLQALWELAPDICANMAVTPIEGICPIHNAVRLGVDKLDIDFEAFSQTLIKTLPADYLYAKKQTIDAFTIQTTNGPCSVMAFAEYASRNCPHKETITFALSEALNI